MKECERPRGLAERMVGRGTDAGVTRVALLTGSQGTAARRRALLEAASGEAAIGIGPHALLAGPGQLGELGLIGIDQQGTVGGQEAGGLRPARTHICRRPPSPGCSRRSSGRAGRPTRPAAGSGRARSAGPAAHRGRAPPPSALPTGDWPASSRRTRPGSSAGKTSPGSSPRSRPRVMLTDWAWASMLFSTNSAMALRGLACERAMIRMAFQSSPIRNLPLSDPLALVAFIFVTMKL